jgi:hypothetical protein
MCTHCPGLRQNIHGPSDCVLPHGHVGDCSKGETFIEQQLRARREAQRIPIKPPPGAPWFVPIIAELLPATSRKTAREMPRPNFTYVRNTFAERLVSYGITVARQFLGGE